MRRKKTADPVGHGRLLEAWIPPTKAGEALGCIATTFTFQASFFETECLGRMLQLECDPDTSGAAYLVEREEKMARMMSASVVADAAHARGQRSLRWDLIPFRASPGIYRESLMDYWGGACAVTGIAIPELLRASHAKPWAECATDAERLNVFNGFLLTAHLDALFDRHLMTFSDTGNAIFAAQIDPTIRSKLGLPPQVRLRWLREEHQPFLRYHREAFERRKGL